MSGFIEGFRNGTWLTRERTRFIGMAVFVASSIGLVLLVGSSDGLIDRMGRPLGTDFSNVYAAGTYVLEGRPEAPFDPAIQETREREIFGAATPFYGWHYPPYFLFLAAVLAVMPYALSLAIWQSVTLGLYLWAIREILLRFWPPAIPGASRTEARGSAGASTSRGAAHFTNLWLLFALAYPAVLINIGHGHNGFLTAALIGGALVLLDARPVLAGILFGLMAYKPQFGVLIPLVLAVSGRWKTFAAAAGTVAALTLATVAAFGPNVWDAFFASTHFTRVVVLEAGQTGWHKIQSIFSWVRMWGGSVPFAYAMQGIATAALAGALVWLWRSKTPFPRKAAALCIACLLATPYSLDYDLMALAPAIAFLAADGAARGFAPYEKSALALLWLMPLIARSVAQATLIPLAVPIMILVFVLILGRALIAARRAESDKNASLLFSSRGIE